MKVEDPRRYFLQLPLETRLAFALAGFLAWMNVLSGYLGRAMGACGIGAGAPCSSDARTVGINSSPSRPSIATPAANRTTLRSISPLPVFPVDRYVWLVCRCAIRPWTMSR